VTTQQSEPPIVQQNIFPVTIPIQMAYKPAKIDFKLSAKDEKNRDITFTGNMIITKMSQSLLWQKKINLRPGVFIEIRMITDERGHVKEWEPPTINIPLKEEEKKEFDSLVNGIKNNTFMGDEFPINPVISGDEIFTFQSNDESDTEVRGKLEGWTYENNQKVLYVSLIGSTKGPDEYIHFTGYCLLDDVTFQMIKFEFLLDGKPFVKYQASVTPQ
jgi:hypothetical protein